MEAKFTITALVGKGAAKLALSQAQPGTAICREVNIPYSPLLSIKQNAAQLRILLDEEQSSWLQELIDNTELKKQGWSKPFRKNQTGLLRLWGILTALLTRPDEILALEPMAGMTAADRDAFRRLLTLSTEKGICFCYTAERLFDVMRLDLPQRVRFAAGADWKETDTAALAAKLDAAETGAAWDELQKSWEDTENG